MRRSVKPRDLVEPTLVAIALLLLSPGYAWAYVDPGTGSYLFQLVIAGGLAGMYTLRRYLAAVKTMLLGKRGGSSHKSGADPGNGMA